SCRGARRGERLRVVRLAAPGRSGQRHLTPSAKIRVDAHGEGTSASHRAKLFRRLPRELHLTLFPQGNPRANGSLAQLKIISMKTSSGRFLQTSSRNFRRRIMKERNI